MTGIISKKFTRNGFLFASLLSCALIILNGCSGPDKSAQQNKAEDAKPEKPRFQISDSTKATLFQVGDEIFSIPSPVQTALLIKSAGADFDMSILNEAHNAPSYSTRFSRALNLGVYGADIGYLTIYDQTQDGLSFMQAAKKIADELGVSSAFDEALFRRFEANFGNQDSLLTLVSDAYRASDAYLKNNDRDDVGSLILAGGWMEALHFAINVYTTTPNDDVKRRIGEQKTSLENLIKILQRYANDEDISEFVDNLIELYYMFEDVEVTYSYKEPTHFPKQKLTHINSSSNVAIDDEQLEAIADMVEIIRNQIVE